MKRVLLFAAIGAASLLGCNEADPCEDVICNYGNCNDGDCNLWRESILGAHVGLLSCGGQSETIIVSAGTSDDIVNFDNGFFARMTSEEAFTIPYQSYFDVAAQQNYQITGTGVVTNGNITMSFTVTYQGQSMACVFTES